MQWLNCKPKTIMKHWARKSPTSCQSSVSILSYKEYLFTRTMCSFNWILGSSSDMFCPSTFIYVNWKLQMDICWELGCFRYYMYYIYSLFLKELDALTGLGGSLFWLADTADLLFWLADMAGEAERPVLFEIMCLLINISLLYSNVVMFLIRVTQWNRESTWGQEVG